MSPYARARHWWTAAAIAVCAVACEGAPGKELDQAQAAIEAARLTGANQYAHDEFAAAEDALRRARQAVLDRDYRLALNDALDARERAQTAMKEGVDRQATARADADHALGEAMAAVKDARARLATAESAKVPDRALDAPRQTLTDAEQMVQESRAAFDRGEYLQVREPVASATRQLRAVIRELDAMPGGAAGRRRR